MHYYPGMNAESSLTSKGQVTIPAALRRRLGLQPGDRVAFVEEHGEVVLRRVETRIEAAFGLVKPPGGASLGEIEKTIAQARERRARR
jgi:AbrB family looped-hinge helix DNA binding protein